MTMMKKSLLLLQMLNLALLRFDVTEAFSLRSLPSPSRTSSLWSTLSPDDTFTSLSESPDNNKGAISMSLQELADYLGGKGRAQIVWDCYSIGIDPADYFGSIHLGYDDYESILQLMPSTRRTQKLSAASLQKLAALYPNTDGNKLEGGVAKLSYLSKSSDSTTKILLTLADGLQIETVIIPWKGQRSTLCVSSQVGCRQACRFCATAQMGVQRSLTSEEILAQLFFAKKLCRLEGLPDITNVVFMGMGDAADNMDNVVQATQIMTNQELFSLSPSRVTVSTVGPSPQAFTELAKAPCEIAWSVHSVNDTIRKQLVPTTKYSMVELRAGLIQALSTQENPTVMLQVTLMQGINDSIQDAQELAEFTQVILDQVPNSKPIINLIPLNPVAGSEYQRPTPQAVSEFQQHLQSQGLYCHVRTTRGDDTTAACGQLATAKKKKNNNSNLM